MAADAAVSGAVVLAAGGIMLTDWTWLDPAVAIAVSVLIAFTAAGLFRAALHLSLDGVPEGVDLAGIEAWLRSQPAVTDLHNLHVWPLSTTRTALRRRCPDRPHHRRGGGAWHRPCHGTDREPRLRCRGGRPAAIAHRAPV
jgi:Co/Zn/Cd efflux system component